MGGFEAQRLGGEAHRGGLTFSLRTPPRVSPLAIEELSGWHLLQRSGTALPDPPDLLDDDFPF